MKIFEITRENKSYPSGAINAYDVGFDLQREELTNLINDVYIKRKIKPLPDLQNVYQLKGRKLIQELSRESYPLKSLLGRLSSMEYISPSLLCYWEILDQFLIPRMKQIANERRDKAKTKLAQNNQDSDYLNVLLTEQTLTSFHAHDNNLATLSALHSFTKRLSQSIGIAINWKWFATYYQECSAKKVVPLHKQNWSTGGDGSGTCNANNIRTHRNKLALSGLSLNLYFYDTPDGPSESIFCAAGIVQGLTLLSSDGMMIVKIPLVFHTSLLSMLFISAGCFDSTKIVKCAADDQQFLVCEGYTPLKAKQLKELSEYATFLLTNMSLNFIPFTANDQFAQFAARIMQINEELVNGKIKHHQNLLDVHNEILTHQSNEYFNNIVEDLLKNKYPDTAAEQWHDTYELVPASDKLFS